MNYMQSLIANADGLATIRPYSVNTREAVRPEE